jgi:hypothetical protein
MKILQTSFEHLTNISYEHLTTILTFVRHYPERAGIDDVDIFKGKGKLT